MLQFSKLQPFHQDMLGQLIRRISAVSNAIQTKDNEANHLIYYLNCIQHSRNATFEPGLIV